MAIQYIAKVLDDPYFGPSQKTELLVAIAIADRARKEDGRAWPSIESLAQRARTSIRGVQDACKKLEKAGKLRIVPGGGVNGTNAYYLLFTPAAIAPLLPQPLRGGGCNGAPEEAAVQAAEEAPIQAPEDAAAKAAEEAPDKAAAGCTQTVRNRQDPLLNRQDPLINDQEHTHTTLAAARSVCVLADSMKGFEEFWNAYPAKHARGDAEKAWKDGNCAEMADVILQSVYKAVGQERWAMEGGRYIPYPAKWLRGKGWEDDFTPPTSSGRMTSPSSKGLMTHMDHGEVPEGFSSMEWEEWLEMNYYGKLQYETALPSLKSDYERDRKLPEWAQYMKRTDTLEGPQRCDKDRMQQAIRRSLAGMR